MKIQFRFILFFISLFCLQTKTTAQQSGKVIYKVRPNPNFHFGVSDDFLLQKLPQKVKDSILKLPEKQRKEVLNSYRKQTDKDMQRMDAFEQKVLAIASDFEFILKFNQSESIFSIDPPMRDEYTDKSMFVLAKLEAGGDFVFYTKRNDSVYYMTNPNKKPEVWTKYKMRKWTITNETGTIGKYKVIKAVSGRVTAWFTPDIPVPFGPKSLGGLPGLILQVDAGPTAIYAYKIELYNKDLKIPQPKGEIIDEKEWKRRRDVEKAKTQSGFIKRR